ncbi:MAG: UDP-N-acetylmuramoyl-tripeptide--D-alanyl-D-alanine ligase [bacterium]|nr:UDP-N-acetylmuramoyl-tripeptide--D-alanyl-D-alanine ligase [bacterium]
MRSFLRNQLRGILRLLVRWTLRKYQPGIVGITGTVGKTSTKEAILTTLRSIRKVRASTGNFNNEFGLPLTILGTWEKSGGIFFWIKVILSSLMRLVIRGSYPEILVLEYGADKPGDLKYLLEMARPQIGVVTAIGDIPVHVEFYSGPDAVAREKARLVEALPAIGFSVLNFDDEAVYEMREKTRAHVITFGFASGAEVRITNFENRMEDGHPVGLTFKLEYGGSFVPVRLDGAFGRAQAYAAAAAAAVGFSFGMNLVRISEALAYYQVPQRRGRIIKGIKDTLIFDDSYNASPLSMHAAIDTMKDFKALRKIAVLGDMLEIGKYAIEAHENVGRLAEKVFDIIITVGPRAKFIADAAQKAGLARKNIFTFDFADEARIPVQDLLKKGDLILIKGSRAIGLDKIVEEIRQM